MKLTLTIASLVGAALIGLATPAGATPAQDPTEVWPQDVGIAWTALPCVPGGPTAQDAANASALNSQLNNKMRGNMNGYNASCARAVVQSVKNRGFNERAAAIAIATVIVETSIANLDGGDLDSVGLYQQRASWGSFAERTNPDIATGKFLATMQQFYPNGSWNTAPIGEVAADVQRPAEQYRYRYGVEANDAVIIANFLWRGGGGSSLSGDGRAEFASVQADGVVRAWYNAAGFAAMPWGGDNAVIATGFAPATTKFADLDGDGKTDILAVQPNGEVRAWRNGIGFGPTPWRGDNVIVANGVTDPARVKFADLDGDRRAEILAVQPNGEVRAWHNCAGFAPMPWCGDSVIIATGVTDPNQAFFADLDADAKSEIMAVQANGEFRAWHNVMGFAPTPWRGDSVIIATGFAAATTKFGDLDGDGKSEIMAVLANGEVRAWHNVMGFAPSPWRGDNVVVATGVTEPARAFFI